MKLRKALLSLAAAGLLFASSQVGAADQLVVSTFAINEDIIKSDIFEPFTEQTGVEIVNEAGNSGERFTKLQNNPNAQIDVIELSQSHSTQGVKEGLFEPLDASKVENIDQLIENGKAIVDEAGVPYAVNSLGIIYNPEAIDFEIKEWSDLWNPALEGKIAIPDITATFGSIFMHTVSDYKGVDITEDNGEAAFQGLEELKPNILRTYSKSSDLANLFQSGEIVAAVVGDFAVPMIMEGNSSVQYIVPESGTYANYNTVNVLANSENKEAAYDYVNWRIDQVLQTQVASSLNESPTNANVELSEDVAANKTYGEVAERAKPVDFDFIDSNLETWIQQWNTIINQ